MAHQLVGLPRAAGAYRVGVGGVGAYVRAPLFLGHGHANGQSGFLRHGDVARVVHARGNFGLPQGCQLGLQAQRGHGGKRHGDGATVAGFHLGVQIGFGGAHHVGARLRVGPGRGMQAMLDRGLHELVVSRVKPHQVNTPAKAVVGVEFGLELVGQVAQRQVIGCANVCAKPAEFGLAPLTAFARHSGLQGAVGGEEVVVLQLGGEVAGFVGVGQPGAGLGEVNSGVHWRISRRPRACSYPGALSTR